MEANRDREILIPEGHFEGYCDSCFYGKKGQKDAEGRILCKGEPGGYKFPYEKNECRYYISRIKQWIKIALVSYLIITGLEN